MRNVETDLGRLNGAETRLGRRGRRLEPGMIVMTGSSITTKFPVAGDRIRFVIDGLGEVALEASR